MMEDMNAKAQRSKERKEDGLKWISLRSLLLCAFAFVFLFGCDSKSDSAAQKPKITLQLNWKPEPQFGGFYAAKEMGVFAKHGLDVDVVAGGVGTPTVQMVAAGTVPFGIASADEIVIARSNGADVVALLPIFGTNPQGIMTHAERNFANIGDIFKHDGTLAIQRGLPYAAFLEKKYGFDKLKIVPSPGGDLSAFRSDPNYSMQCFVTSEPLAAKKAGLAEKTFLVAEAGYNPYTTVLVTRGDYARANKAQTMKMVQAVREGWQAYLADPAKTNAAMQQLNPSMDAQTFADSAAAQKPLIEPEFGVMKLERWKTLIDQLVELKAIETAPSADTCFIEYVQ
jgi:NitT/TauT family transport system substrate-binding protein